MKSEIFQDNSRQVGIAWIFLKSKFISKAKKIQVNTRLDSLDYS